ncbi:glycine--tRNA ligase subunit beta [Ferrovibrio terrae]|uniref:Glycine--tRNA ligase beta subunit n=1 Tax=Ferrovibrio terrae TaxID=2594003 RepID=A0A516GWQ2_9PROT|nr:glycine--tRNA ligase subunit beta [Ferrovibrio terrae]QDO95957.1 glycine--tRNA ligase subunit beta [Ferrovibrio terrae]
MLGELLLELHSEEIPARMQQRAAEDLQRLVTDLLKKSGLHFDKTESYVTPRRLALVVRGLPRMQDAVREEKKGPRVGSPDAAVQGFLRGAGLTSLDSCEKRDTGKGEFWFAIVEKPGEATKDALRRLIPDALAALPWPKSMRWADQPMRWVRPLHSIICLFEGETVPFTFGHLTASDTTCGHRFQAPARFSVRDAGDYLRRLRVAYVEPDFATRRAAVLKDAAFAAGNEDLVLVDDPGLADEVTGLVEQPVVLLGRIPQDFMSVPREVLTTTMRTHQKYFALNTKDGALAPRFVIVANTMTDDGGKQVIAGNERVLNARLSDAKFFWDQDRKVTLESRLPALKDIVFHARLGTVAQKVERVERLAYEIASALHADAKQARRAAKLAKADLVSGLVGEFPELQGVMGRYYALNDGEPAEVAEAIAQHYAPQGPNDRCPTAPVSVAVALADKIDTLAGFFAIDEKPTGSKDPFALRRAALGVIRLILENRLALPLKVLFRSALSLQIAQAESERSPTEELMQFFVDRLKVYLREQGVRHDLVAAIFAKGNDDDLLRILAKVEALRGFLTDGEGANLLVAYRRANNIVRAEMKKTPDLKLGEIDGKLIAQDEERVLVAALGDLGREASGKTQDEADFRHYLATLARLRAPVDAFFDRVTVNADVTTVRRNRLSLLSAVVGSMDRIADFSQIEG